jgi:hypothetical protein
MTHRQRFDCRYRTLTFMVFGSASVVAGVVIAQRNLDLPQALLSWVVVPGVFVIIPVAVFGQYFAFHCPKCGANLGTLLMSQGVMLRACPHYCPHCAFDLDHMIGENDSTTIPGPR